MTIDVDKRNIYTTPQFGVHCETNQRAEGKSHYHHLFSIVVSSTQMTLVLPQTLHCKCEVNRIAYYQYTTPISISSSQLFKIQSIYMTIQKNYLRANLK